LLDPPISRTLGLGTGRSQAAFNEAKSPRKSQEKRRGATAGTQCGSENQKAMSLEMSLATMFSAKTAKNVRNFAKNELAGTQGFLEISLRPFASSCRLLPMPSIRATCARRRFAPVCD
jgi:hypothetical protein